MQSLKSTGIAVLLLAVSVGLYQYSANDNSSSEVDLISELGVSDGSQPTFNSQPFANQQTGNYPLANQHANQPNQHGQLSGQLVSNPSQSLQLQAPQQLAPQQLAPQQMPPQQLAPSFGGAQSPQFNGNNATSSFDQLRDKFNQSSNNAINSGVEQTNQQFANLQDTANTAGQNLNQNFSQLKDQASGQINQFSQAANQTVNGATEQVNQLASNFRSGANSLQQNLSDQANQFQQNMPDLAAATSATRQAIPSGRDEGLIDALQSEFSNASEKVSAGVASASDFSAAPVLSSPQIDIDNDFSKNDFQPELQAQTIELADNAKNRLASEQSPIGGLEFDVQQANLNPVDKAGSLEEPANIDQAWSRVEKMVEEKRFRNALGLLTRYYRRDDLTAAQRKKLNDWLDALAGKVIYSTENHFTSTPYMIKTGETLTDIANRWNVPAQVVYNINRQRLGSEPKVVAGTELKMINGPFHAEVDLSSQTLTLFLKDLYAGRFPVKVGISGDPRPGDFNVVAKSVQGHTWRDADGNDFPPDSPENGYGPYWIGMTGSLCIHALTEGEVSGHSGCIGLDEKDAKDIFGILANRSQVKVIP